MMAANMMIRMTIILATTIAMIVVLLVVLPSCPLGAVNEKVVNCP